MSPIFGWKERLVLAEKASRRHTHLESEVNSLISDLEGKATLATVKADSEIADAVSKKHAQNGDTDLDATFEATFEKVGNKGGGSGYAPLDAGSKVPAVNLGGAEATGSKYLRSDQTWQTPAGGSEAYPIGSVFLAVVDTNPVTLLGYGTWAQIAQGQFLVGQKGSDADFDVAEETGGAKTHTHATHTDHTHAYTEVPNHVHVQKLPSGQTGSQASGTRDTSTTGSTADALSTANPTGGVASGTTVNQSAAQSHDSPGHLPPYFVVYCWRRDA